MQAPSLLDCPPLPFSLPESAWGQDHGQLATSDLQREMSDFCAAAREQSTGLNFAPRSIASDILSIFAAGALIERMRESELNYSACGRALRAMLRDRFHWDDCDAAIRAGVLLAAARDRECRLAAAIEHGAAAMHAWQNAERRAFAGFREIYADLSARTPRSART